MAAVKDEEKEAEMKMSPNDPPFLYLLSAFLAMEPVQALLNLARECGGGSITMKVQEFIWRRCITGNLSEGKLHVPYLRNFVKKLIGELESNHEEVLDELYEKYTKYIVAVKDDGLVKGESMTRKCISFLFTPDCLEVKSCPSSLKFVVPLQCSINMLEGDTGCSVWPSSLLLSELVLSRPDIFSNRSCFEVGSGVGLVGICLAHVRARKIILSDGDLSTLSNMKINLELNNLESKNEFPERTPDGSSLISCIHLPWEYAAEKRHQLQALKLDIFLAADVIYNPSCLPHLVRLLSILLNQQSSAQDKTGNGGAAYHTSDNHQHSNGSNSNSTPATSINCSQATPQIQIATDLAPLQTTRSPIAYIASVIRNADTFNYFLKLADEANLSVTDVTENLRPPNLLPYMHSYEKSNIHLFVVSYSYTN